jgi:hypothetical protein
MFASDLQRLLERSEYVSRLLRSRCMSLAVQLGDQRLLPSDVLFGLSDVLLCLVTRGALTRGGVLLGRLLRTRCTASRARSEAILATCYARLLTGKIWLPARMLLHGFGDAAAFQAGYHADACLARATWTGAIEETQREPRDGKRVN